MNTFRNALIICCLTPIAGMPWRAGSAAEESPDPGALYQERSISYTGGEYKEQIFRYRLLAPIDHDPSSPAPGKTWPLILFLHGAGERGDDNRAQLKYFPTDMATPENRARFRAFILAPQCPAGRQWSRFSWQSKDAGFPAEPAEEARAALQMLDQVSKELPVDPDRIYLTGLSMGGYGSWDLAARYPEKWAAVVPICGGGNPGTASRIKDLPIWVFHGSKDGVVPPERSRIMVEALKRAGAFPRYTEFPDAGHDSWTPAYRHPEFLTWLFARKRGGAPVDPGRAPDASREWFQDAKFGLFIHWGVYSLLGRGEWVMNNEKIPIAEYEKLPPRFNPTEFDAAKWVEIAKRAGQRYITITSKHHDGFCMWDSKQTKYDIVDGTPYGKDVLRMLAEECRKQGIKLFFYHSHLDWHHPDYWPRGGTGRHSGRAESGDWGRYMDYLNAQIAELCSPPYDADGIWFDGWWDRPDADWQLGKTYGIIHGLRPEAMVGNNHHVSPYAGEDFQMFEQDLPGKNTAGFNTTVVSPLPLETCRTMNNSWGYNKDDKAYRPVAQQIRYLVEAVGLGANLLLNVGPMPNGEFPPEAVETLLAVGRWLDSSGEAIYGTRPGPWTGSREGLAVRKGRRAYFHVLEWPPSGRLALPMVEGLVKASILNGAAIDLSREGDDIILNLPEGAKDPVAGIAIVAFDFDRDVGAALLPVPPRRSRIGGEKTVLSAVEAVPTGGIRFEGEPKNALGSWQDPKDSVTWDVRSGEAAELDVSISYACAKGSAGSEFEVVCGESRTMGKVLESGDWSTFITVPLGTIALPEGDSQITVRVLSKPAAADGVMNLRDLQLEEGFVSLFDGKSLRGWFGSSNDKGERTPVQGYEVRDGVIACMPGGNMYTDKEYSDFVFRFEVRFLEAAANNGLGIRTPDRGDAAYVGMELQILDDPAYGDTIRPEQHHGSIYDLVAAKPGHLRPVGEWNVEEVVARGPRITVKLNGVTIVDADLEKVKQSLPQEKLDHHPGMNNKSGYIGFLGHGSRLEFRDIRIKYLAAPR